MAFSIQLPLASRNALADSQARRSEAARAALAELVELAARGPVSAKTVQRVKLKHGEAFGLAHVLKSAELLEQLPLGAPRSDRVFQALSTNPVRDVSGVSVLAVMTKPMGCVGTCTYCPGGVTSAKSYTGFEPAARRAAQNDFDSFRQIDARLKQLRATGHDPQKCEIIMMGSTFGWMPAGYQAEFVKGVFDGLNGVRSASLEEAHLLNEAARSRCVGLVAETRPDWCREEDVRKFLDYGVTRVELGVQSLDDAVLEKVKRGHGVQAVRSATSRLRRAFYKIGYHVMPGLYSTEDSDVQMFKTLFDDPDFRPDMLKIYPCLVMPNTPLYDAWKRGEYQPYDAVTAARVLARAKRFLPRYCRIMRIERDIPTNLVAGGVMNSNLRQLVQAEMKRNGWHCACIRCREVGIKRREGLDVDFARAELRRMDYEAAGGREVFLSFDDPKADALLGFIRLRAPNEDTFLEEVDARTAGIRELHVYGDQVELGERKAEAAQHQGFGAQLLDEAERIARDEFDANKMAIISGVGTRAYYRKFAYERARAFMLKALS